VFAVTRQAITNDDHGAFARLPQLFGYAAAALESDLVYGVLTGNPLMADGFALFSAQHKNLASAATIDVAGMTAARTLMRTQTSTDGTPLAIEPRFLIVGPALETAALQFTNTSIVPTQPSGVIPQYFQSLTVIVDPRITDASWYLAASPDQIDTVEVARLHGSDEAPEVLAQVAWDIDAHEFKGRIDRAVGAIDWRGLVKTPSA
jgi:phage major head subunit gpT-like protein